MFGFSIDVQNLHWLSEEEEQNDLCAHGLMTAVIGDETFALEGTASAAALYLLKTLTENHAFGEDNQMMPCCGHFMIANETLDNVQILGCFEGVDWEVTHQDDKVQITTETGKTTVVDEYTYRQAIFAFADKVETFYKNSREKMLPEDEFDRNGYIAFWNEWNHRRSEKK